MPYFSHNASPTLSNVNASKSGVEKSNTYPPLLNSFTNAPFSTFESNPIKKYLKDDYIIPPTPLNFSTNAAINWNTLCFLVKYIGFNGLIFGKILLKSVPFSLTNSRFKETVMYRLASSSFRFSEVINSDASCFCLLCAYSKNDSIILALSVIVSKSVSLIKSTIRLSFALLPTLARITPRISSINEVLSLVLLFFSKINSSI